MLGRVEELFPGWLEERHPRLARVRETFENSQSHFATRCVFTELRGGGGCCGQKIWEYLINGFREVWLFEVFCATLLVSLISDTPTFFYWELEIQFPWASSLGWILAETVRDLWIQNWSTNWVPFFASLVEKVRFNLKKKHWNPCSSQGLKCVYPSWNPRVKVTVFRERASRHRCFEDPTASA